MKDLRFSLGAGSLDARVDEIVRELERGSAESAEAVIADFSVTGTLTELRTIDAGTATLAQLRNFVCTLVADIQKKGQNRSQ